MRWKLLLLAVSFFVATGAATAQDLTGNWQGTLDVGDKGLRTVIKVTKDDGKYKGVLYSVDQSAVGFPMTTLVLDGKAVQFTIQNLDVSYAGTLSPDGTTITGKATQGGQTHELDLQHVTEEATWAIPKPPVQMPANATPKFDVATVKPSPPDRQGKQIGFRGREFLAMNFDVNDLISLAYGIHAKQVVGAPDWTGSELFDITGVPDVEGQPSNEQMKMLQKDLLATRFQLKFHYEKRELPVYALTVGKGGPKMAVSTAAADAGSGFGFRALGDLTVHNLTMAEFVKWMQSSVMDRPVVDQTGLTDRYDFRLRWTPDSSQFAAFRSAGLVPNANPDDPNAPPSLYTATQDQLGLKLEPAKAPVDVMVIDHIEQPSAN